MSTVGESLGIRHQKQSRTVRSSVKLSSTNKKLMDIFLKKSNDPKFLKLFRNLHDTLKDNINPDGSINNSDNQEEIKEAIQGFAGKCIEIFHLKSQQDVTRFLKEAEPVLIKDIDKQDDKDIWGIAFNGKTHTCNSQHDGKRLIPKAISPEREIAYRRVQEQLTSNLKNKPLYFDNKLSKRLQEFIKEVRSEKHLAEGNNASTPVNRILDVGIGFVSTFNVLGKEKEQEAVLRLFVAGLTDKEVQSLNTPEGDIGQATSETKKAASKAAKGYYGVKKTNDDIKKVKAQMTGTKEQKDAVIKIMYLIKDKGKNGIVNEKYERLKTDLNTLFPQSDGKEFCTPKPDLDYLDTEMLDNLSEYVKQLFPPELSEIMSGNGLRERPKLELLKGKSKLLEGFPKESHPANTITEEKRKELPFIDDNAKAMNETGTKEVSFLDDDDQIDKNNFIAVTKDKIITYKKDDDGTTQSLSEAHIDKDKNVIRFANNGKTYSAPLPDDFISLEESDPNALLLNMIYAADPDEQYNPQNLNRQNKVPHKEDVVPPLLFTKNVFEGNKSHKAVSAAQFFTKTRNTTFETYNFGENQKIIIKNPNDKNPEIAIYQDNGDGKNITLKFIPCDNGTLIIGKTTLKLPELKEGQDHQLPIADICYLLEKNNVLSEKPDITIKTEQAQKIREDNAKLMAGETFTTPDDFFGEGDKIKKILKSPALNNEGGLLHGMQVDGILASNKITYLDPAQKIGLVQDRGHGIICDKSADDNIMRIIHVRIKGNENDGVYWTHMKTGDKICTGMRTQYIKEAQKTKDILEGIDSKDQIEYGLNRQTSLRKAYEYNMAVSLGTLQLDIKDKTKIIKSLEGKGVDTNSEIIPLDPHGNHFLIKSNESNKQRGFTVSKVGESFKAYKVKHFQEGDITTSSIDLIEDKKKVTYKLSPDEVGEHNDLSQHEIQYKFTKKDYVVIETTDFTPNIASSPPERKTAYAAKKREKQEAAREEIARQRQKKASSGIYTTGRGMDAFDLGAGALSGLGGFFRDAAGSATAVLTGQNPSSNGQTFVPQGMAQQQQQAGGGVTPEQQAYFNQMMQQQQVMQQMQQMQAAAPSGNLIPSQVGQMQIPAAMGGGFGGGTPFAGGGVPPTVLGSNMLGGGLGGMGNMGMGNMGMGNMGMGNMGMMGMIPPMGMMW